MLLAMAFRDVLWLRSSLVIALLTIGIAQTVFGSMTAAFWNFLFFGVNAYRAYFIIQERRPRSIAPHLRQVYEALFSKHFTSTEFVNLVNLGNQKNFHDENFIEAGEEGIYVFLIIEGKAEVRLADQNIAMLEKHSFVGEMSFLSGKRTSATVYAVGEVQLICWSRYSLNDLQLRNIELFAKFKDVLGHDLVEKVISSSAAIRYKDQGGAA